MRLGLLVETDVAFVSDEVAGLRALGHEVAVASVFRPEPAPRWQRAFDGPVVYPRRGRSRWLARALREGVAAPRGLARLTRTARAEGAPLRLVALAADLARRARAEQWTHVHGSFATFPAWTAWAVARLAGLPFSFTGHAYDVQRPRLWLPRLLGEAAFARAISRETGARLERLAPEGAVVRVGHLGVDVRRFAPEPLPRGRTPEVVAVARLVPKKGLGLLVDAAAELRRRGRPIRVRIFGEGPLRADLQRRIRDRGLQRRVQLEGGADRDKLIRVLRRASVFALPCVVDRAGEHDGLPVALLEAMACALPVVTTPVGGIADAVEADRNGLLVPPGDPGSLAAALDSLLGDEELRERLGAAARATVVERFRLESAAARLADWIQAAPRGSAAIPTARVVPSVRVGAAS